MDGTPAAEAALPHALGFAARCRAQLWLLTVCDPAELRLEKGRRQTDQLSSLALRLHARTRLLCGSPAQEIVREADYIAPELIVMGTRPGAGIGGVANQVMRQAPCPVLIVREQAQRSREQLAAALAGDYPRYRSILLPVDGTAIAERSLKTGRALARSDEGELTLVQVQDAVYLQALADDPDGRLHTVPCSGSLGDQVVEQDPDLVILSSPQNDVLQKALCPVLVLRSEPGAALL